MIKSYWIALLTLSLIFGCCVVAPVGATLINTTVVSNAVISTSIGTQFSGSSFAFNAVSPNVIQELKISSYTDSIPTFVTLTHSNGNTSVISITTSKISFFQRQQVMSISGGTSSTETVLEMFYPVNRIFFAQSNDTPRTYYLVATDTANFIDLHSYSYDINTDTDAYLILPEQISYNPVTTVSIIADGGRFSGTLYYVKLDSIKSSENNPENLGEPESRDILWLIGQIGLVIEAIALFISQIAVYVTTVGGFVVFIMAGEVFFTIVAAYTIVAAILSVHDSDNLIRSVGKFVKYEMKLFKFFGELIGWVKNIIVWW